MPGCSHARLAFVPALAVIIGSMLSAAPLQDETQAPASVNPRWLDKLDKADRAFVDENIGFAAPDFTADLKWHNATGLKWQDLRGKVVVIQSWTVKTSGGRSAPTRMAKAIESLPADQVQLIALHTPEGLETLEKFLDQRDLAMPVAIDEKGLFCDELGFYQRPSNVVVDKHGAIRYAGLNAAGLEEAVKALVAETFDENKKPEARPKPEIEISDAEFPAFNSEQLTADNIQGSRAPEIFAADWVSERPDLANKVVIVDFSATWCPPCRASFPHMSELATKFRDSLAIVAITNETPQAFRDGLTRYNISPQSIEFSIASDPNTRTMKAVNGRAWPHAMIISSDWIVRWQGNPGSLAESTVRQIVDANKRIVAGANARYRWSGGAR